MSKVCTVRLYGLGSENIEEGLYMQRLIAILREFFDGDSGVTAMEYALLGGLISVVIVVAVTSVGTGVGGLFNFVAEQVAIAAAAGGG